MKTYFPDIVDVDFTANMEERLDDVEMGREEWKQIIRDFYPGFHAAVENAVEKLAKVEIKDEVTDVICEKCGRNMVIKYGRYGKFLACPGFPECQNAKPFFEEAGVNCPECGGKVLIKKTKKGRTYFGCENNPSAASCPGINLPGKNVPSAAVSWKKRARKIPKSYAPMKNAATCGSLNRKKKKIQRNNPLFFQKKLKKNHNLWL